MDIEQLQTFLNEINVPEIKPQPKTFLGIAKQPHYENVLSNIYAFFFDVNEAHGFSDLFIKALLQLVNESYKFDNNTCNEFDELSPETEVGTNKGGRIDILLSNDSQAIIIENKVYHTLNNNLSDYWDSVKRKIKVGIILSLNEIKIINHHGFINITHKQFLDNVLNNAGKYLLDGSDKYLVFLKDLYQNILNLTNKTMKTEEISLYLDNIQKINNIVLLEQRFKEHVIIEVEKACSLLSDSKKLHLIGKRNHRYRYFASPIIPNLVFVIVFDQLFTNEGGLHLIVEPRYREIEKVKKIDYSIFSQEEIQIIKNDFNANSNGVWAHFAHKYYHPNENEIIDLGEFIAEKLKNEHFLSVFNKLEEYLTNYDSK